MRRSLPAGTSRTLALLSFSPFSPLFLEDTQEMLTTVMMIHIRLCLYIYINLSELSRRRMGPKTKKEVNGCHVKGTAASWRRTSSWDAQRERIFLKHRFCLCSRHVCKQGTILPADVPSDVLERSLELHQLLAPANANDPRICAGARRTCLQTWPMLRSGRQPSTSSGEPWERRSRYGQLLSSFW